MVPLTDLWGSERGCLHEKLIYDRLVRAALGNVSAEGLKGMQHFFCRTLYTV